MEAGVRGYTQTLLEHAYVWTACLLIAHQVDSGYWQEWRLFGLSGDIQGFVLGNVALIAPFLYGLVQVVKAPRIGARFGLALSVIGVAAFCIHAWFLVQGRPEFRVPVSIAVLTAALVTSVGLAWASVKTLRAGQAR
jgi:hypothetical protein